MPTIDSHRSLGKIRVMIVEDSRVVREFLQAIISRDPRLEVVAAVDSGEKALRVLRYATPDVISLDIRLPGIDGYETTRRIMAQRPTPIVVVSASVTSDDQQAAIHALQAGAVSAVEKPVGMLHPDFSLHAERLCAQLAAMSQVRVIRQRFNHPRELPRRSRLTGQPAGPARHPGAGPFSMLGVVASTGGPSALERMFKSLSADFPLPIVVVQHITACFHSGFVDWLGTVCPQPVVEAEHGQIPLPGTIYLAPADRHLIVGSRGLELGDGPLTCMQRPSGTVLFESMAHGLGSQALGVLLTGMGNDGAEGLLAIHQAGGYTVAEHESTAVVYGMPSAAVQLGAVDALLPLDEIGEHLLPLVTPLQEICS